MLSQIYSKDNWLYSAYSCSSAVPVHSVHRHNADRSTINTVLQLQHNSDCKIMHLKYVFIVLHIFHPVYTSTRKNLTKKFSASKLADSTLLQFPA